MRFGGRGWMLDGAWLLACVVGSSAWCVSASARLGATFDEPTYVRLGLESWRTGTSRRLLDLGTMPLPAHATTLPLYAWERWQGEPFDAGRDLDRLLPVARLVVLPFWWVLLVYGWRAGRQMAGPWGGRLAAAFLACEPNLLAHAALATTDVAVTAALVVLLFHFQAGRDGPWWRRVGVPAACFAFTVLCKASGMAFAVIGITVVEVVRRVRANPLTPNPSPPRGEGRRSERLRAALAAIRDRGFRRDLFHIVGLGLVVVFVYCGSDWCVSPSFVEWAQGLPEGPVRSVMVWCADHCRIFSNAGMALVRQVRHNVQGHGVFLDGQVARRAIWYYFPTALSIKATVPTLLLPLLLVLVGRRALGNWACGAAVALLMFSLVCRVQIGIRLMLPLLALACVGLGAAMACAWQQVQTRGLRRIVAGAAAVACGWMAWSALDVWPNGLCFTNELWGGTAGGYRLLSDSNYDWGQGLKELAGWQARHRAANLDVLYYGTDPALEHLPLHPVTYADLHTTEPDEIPKVVQGRTLAVSTTILYGSISEQPHWKPLVTWLRQFTPADRTTTFLIFRFPAAQARGG
jgi:hypothetical protein